MGNKLRSVGLDVGTTTTQLVVSRLELENTASGFAVPKMQIVQRQVLYQSPVLLTPMRSEKLVDGQALRAWVQQQYRAAEITPETVDTGAVIITGETSRKENAAQVLKALSDYAGDFVVATAGPHLESVLAAKGAGAVAYSATTQSPVLHIDIGGGTANLAWLRKGQVEKTGCMNVGGRLVRTGEGKILYVSEAVASITDLRPGDAACGLEQLCQNLVQALEMAAGLREPSPLLDTLWTKECGPVWEIPREECILSFSGGVADCIEESPKDDAFGDIGPMLGRAIRNSLLCRGAYMLGKHTIRATVIGAGSYSTSLSGSTVYCKGVQLPLKNLPVVQLISWENAAEEAERALQKLDTPRAFLSLPGGKCPGYGTLYRLAQQLSGLKPPFYICLEADMAKALGQCLQLQQPQAEILCIDGITLPEDSFLDVGQPVGPCFPVVVKTLVLG